MGDLGIPDLHGDRGQPCPDVVDPIVPAHHREGLGDRFVERLGGHVERMRGLRSWTTTVQALRTTMAIYHIRRLFACGIQS